MSGRIHLTNWVDKINTLVSRGQSRDGLLLFYKLHKSGDWITRFLLSAVLKGCTELETSQEGKQAHCAILKHGFHSDVVLMTSLLNVYYKCISIEEARRVFDEMPERDVVATNSLITGLCRYHLTSDAVQLFERMSERDVGSWNCLISGLAQNFEGEKALSFFRKMRSEGKEFDFRTMVSVLSVCADLAALVNGKQIHGLVIKYGFEPYLPIGNAIVDMYGKSGCMDDACACFDNMPAKNVVSWTSLMVGYGKHGLGLEALKAFDRMEMEGIQPNKVTFLGILFACSHAGLVQEGWRSFNTMVCKYTIQPMMEHYTCMVDLFARAGHLKEANDFIERMPIEPDAKLLTAFLRSCFSFMNVEITKRVGQRLLELKPEAGAYMLLSNFYGVVGDLDGIVKVRKLMTNRGVRKEKAYTWIEINRRVHAFESGDRSHPLHEEICDYMKNLIEKIKNYGYVPNTTMVMQNLEEHKKEEILLGHSEKLAIGLGLISTPPGTRITIVKNLRVCNDCHDVTKLISRIDGREIVARDSSRFHHFKQGACSCGNHWDR
ncbi:pentatricopeptide repeat-containing protein ELI1, chloroplastic-like isoform X2 [Macadamia integrifolia]|uniref:pentatricopeptide repeat-containing protein ELI1, chloroplastic-like isoform X2 n=1 Tax=Macadamia integrifolia TaxID=60698 RepID=UPI001C4F4467|nr:pentatricopeptide repeat-containing protein ELI1, chloroplastic-like isoform X2 [Macadamia integrifolia]